MSCQQHNDYQNAQRIALYEEGKEVTIKAHHQLLQGNPSLYAKVYNTNKINNPTFRLTFVRVARADPKSLGARALAAQAKHGIHFPSSPHSRGLLGRFIDEGVLRRLGGRRCTAVFCRR